MLHEEIRKRVRDMLYLLDGRELQRILNQMEDMIARRSRMVEAIREEYKKTNVL